MLVVGLIAAGLFGLGKMMKQSEPFRESLSEVRGSEDAMGYLGEPVAASWLVLGSIRLENDDGEVDLRYRVRGRMNGGQVRVRGTKFDGTWTYERMELELGDGSVIDFLE